MTPVTDAFFAAHRRGVLVPMRVTTAFCEQGPVPKRNPSVPCTRFICSQVTFRELVRESYNAGHVFHSPVKSEPDRVFGVPVAYDDSLPDGVVLSAYTGEASA